jgi:hypothetical protein
MMSRISRFLRDPKAVSKVLRIAATVITMVAQVISILLG